MMDFNERVIPGVTANFQFKESSARYEFARKIFKKGTKVLDVGCGTGYGSSLLAKKCKVFAIDINEEAINFARKHYSNRIKFRVAKTERLPFKNQEFDAICSFEVIEHIEKVDRMLKEIYRVLKNGGKFVLSTPNRGINSPDGKFKSPYHVREYIPEEFLELLKKYFPKVEIKSQKKNEVAEKAFKDFLESQKAREKIVDRDVLGIRKVIPVFMKERIWKYAGNLFGRRTQESLKTFDFPIKSGNLKSAEYLIAVCEK